MLCLCVNFGLARQSSQKVYKHRETYLRPREPFTSALNSKEPHAFGNRAFSDSLLRPSLGLQVVFLGWGLDVHCFLQAGEKFSHISF